MTPAELRSALDRLGLSQADFSRVIGKDPKESNTVRRWASGVREMPSEAVTLVNLMLDGVATVEQVREAANKKPATA